MDEDIKEVNKDDSCKLILPGNKILSCKYGRLKVLAAAGAAVLLAAVGLAGYFGYHLYEFRAEQAAFSEYKLHKADEQAKMQKLLNDNEKMLRDMAELSNLEKKLRRALIRDVDSSKLSSNIKADAADVKPQYLGQGGDHDMDAAAMKNVLAAQNTNIQQMIAERKKTIAALLEEVEGRGGTLAAFPDKWPVDGGTVSSGYGGRTAPIGEGYDWHPGIDIAADFGEPVYASGAGVVEQAGWNGGYGRYVRIDHGNGYASAYGHMSGLVVAAGQHVAKGEIIGFVGSTGYSTGPHVHFEVLADGQTIDPYYLVKR